MENQTEKPPSKPLMNPYIFTLLLLAFGLWCFWDGWVAKDTGMEGYVITMNRVASLILIPWAVWDFIKVRRAEAAPKQDDSDSSQSGNGEST